MTDLSETNVSLWSLASNYLQLCALRRDFGDFSAPVGIHPFIKSLEGGVTFLCKLWEGLKILFMELSTLFQYSLNMSPKVH